MSSDAASNRESERRLVDAICNGGAGAEQAEERLLFELCHPAFSWLAAKEERDDANAAYNDLLVATHTHLSANSWRRLRKWTGESPLEAWLWVVIENLQKSLWRKTNRRRTREVGVADPAQFHDDAEHADVRVDADLDARVTGEKIVGAIAALD
ncbi:MAG TPA: hypothetical protein VGE52_19855, partial [Pirellulales bacterium]